MFQFYMLLYINCIIYVYIYVLYILYYYLYVVYKLVLCLAHTYDFLCYLFKHMFRFEQLVISGW